MKDPMKRIGDDEWIPATHEEVKAAQEPNYDGPSIIATVAVPGQERGRGDTAGSGRDALP